MNIKEIIKGIALSIVALIGGFIAVGLPFKLFGNLTGDALRIFFIIEMALYILVGCIFLLFVDKKKQRRVKEQQRLIRRQEKIDDVIENWYNLAA